VPSEYVDIDADEVIRGAEVGWSVLDAESVLGSSSMTPAVKWVDEPDGDVD
jgi:hypothetical protein